MPVGRSAHSHGKHSTVISTGPLTLALSGVSAVASGGAVVAQSSGTTLTLTGLNWDGTASTTGIVGGPDARRMLYWASPPPMYPMTFLFKVYQRQQVGDSTNGSGVSDGSRYYTTFFWGNNGAFQWNADTYRFSYYGAHPYPFKPTGDNNKGDGKWEISFAGEDKLNRDNDPGVVTIANMTSAPYMVPDQWYSQAFVATSSQLKYYLALPSVATVNTITRSSQAAVVPPSPAIVFGQAPNVGGASWGGYSRWEEQNAIIRGIQMYTTALTQTQVLALAAFEYDSEVLAYCASNGLTSSLWYLNMNPTPSDVTDKSGAGHHGAWDGTARPTLYTTGIDRLTINTEVATPEQIGLYLVPSATIAAGSTVTVRYKQSSSGTWLTAHPLLRITPTGNEAGTGSVVNPIDSFAGSIFDLTPGTQYDVELTHVEAGQSTKVTTIQRTTRALPAAAGTPNKNATVGGTSLQTLFNGLVAGDVLQLADGTYNVSALTLSNGGNSGSPIYIRGASRSGVIVKYTGIGNVLSLNASHVVIENLTIEGSSVDAGTEGNSDHNKGIVVGGNRTNVTVRNVTMVGVDQAITTNSAQTGMLVYSNTLTGNNLWNATFVDSNITWDDDCIRIPGFGNCAWSNTVTGFGDFAAVMAGERSEGVYFYRNRVIHTGDDAFEGDYSTRNVGFYDNYITNCSTALSLDPVYGGPLYYFRNVVINVARSPWKFNANNTGALIYSNTIVRTNATNASYTGWGEVQYNNGGFGNFSYRNNMLVYRGSGGTWAFESSPISSPLDLTHNAWFPNSTFLWTNSGGSFANLAAVQSGIPNSTPLFGSATKRHANDVVVVSNPWTDTVTLAADHLTQFTGTPGMALAAGAAKNTGTAISGITDGFSGAAPDMGAIIAGRATVTYGDTSGTPAWMSGLALLTWRQLSGTSPTSAGMAATTLEYSGATLKASNSQLIVFGGGHPESDNAVVGVLLSADAPTSVILNAATPSAQRTFNSNGYYADGKPASRHSWGDLAVDESVNRMITMQCSNPYGDSGVWSAKRDGFNLATNTWLAAGTYNDAPVSGYTPATSCTKDASGNIYWWNETSGNIYKIVPGAVGMALFATHPVSGIYNYCLACDTSRNRIVAFGPSSPSHYNLSTGARTGISFGGAQASVGSSNAYWAYCPERDSFLGVKYNDGGSNGIALVVYECNASTFSISTLAVAGTAPTITGDGESDFYGRWGYVPNLHGFYILPHTGANVFFFRVA